MNIHTNDGNPTGMAEKSCLNSPIGQIQEYERRRNRLQKVHDPKEGAFARFKVLIVANIWYNSFLCVLLGFLLFMGLEMKTSGYRTHRTNIFKLSKTECSIQVERM